jgi:hypothetical protein
MDIDIEGLLLRSAEREASGSPANGSWNRMHLKDTTAHLSFIDGDGREGRKYGDDRKLEAAGWQRQVGPG